MTENHNELQDEDYEILKKYIDYKTQKLQRVICVLFVIVLIMLAIIIYQQNQIKNLQSIVNEMEEFYLEIKDFINIIF